MLLKEHEIVHIYVNLIYLQAEDTDKDDPTAYSIVAGSMSASEDYLQEVMNNAFEIDAVTGSLKTTFAPKDYMKGYFSFKVQAKDTGKLFFLCEKATSIPDFYYLNKFIN